MFAPDDQRRLLALARRWLVARVHRVPDPPLDSGGALDASRGAFVSIHSAGQLRGCLGRIESSRPVCRVVAQLAREVADSDPRFEPVAPHELTRLHIEISVLTAPSELRRIEDIVIGRHGLIVEQGPHRGLLLPQVAVEYGWNAASFLDHTSLKAGLP